MSDKNIDLSGAAIAALHQRNKIEAIKILRQERGVELKEAKDVVEEYIRTQPLLQSKFDAAQAQSKRGFVFWLLVLVALAALVYYLGATR